MTEHIADGSAAADSEPTHDELRLPRPADESHLDFSNEEGGCDYDDEDDGIDWDDPELLEALEESEKQARLGILAFNSERYATDEEVQAALEKFFDDILDEVIGRVVAERAQGASQT